MDQLDLLSAIDQLGRPRVLVVGDFMLDRYIYGRVDRISPEAPVPVVNVSQRESRPGGAGNVLLNVHALGARAIPLSITGLDEAGDELLQQFAAQQIDTRHIQRYAEIPTITKTRVLAGQHQMLRIDEEDLACITPAMEQQLIATVQRLLKPRTDAVAAAELQRRQQLTGYSRLVWAWSSR